MSSYSDYNEEYLKKEVAKLEISISKEKNKYLHKDLSIIANFLKGEIPGNKSLSFDIQKSFQEETNTKKMQDNNKFLNSYWGNIYVPSLTVFYRDASKYASDDNLWLEYNGLAFIEDYIQPDFSYKEQLTILRDFFSSIEDKEIRKAFENTFKDRRNTLRFNGNSSYVNNFTDSTGKNKSLITINEESQAINLVQLAHEFGHAIDYKNQKPYAYTAYDMFIELASTFFQSLMIEYMKKNNIAELDAIDIETYYHFQSINEIETYLKLYKLKNKYFDNGDLYFKYIKANFPYYVSEKIENTPALFLIRYSYPYALTIELLDIYEKDPEYALHILKELSCSINTSRLKELEKYDIHIGDHVEEKTRKLVTEIKMAKKEHGE